MNPLFNSIWAELRRLASWLFKLILPFLPGPWTLVIAISFFLFCQALKLLWGFLLWLLD
ncbi:hypothetical protein GCM10028805_43960 [Spirosoma harenae]